ncbi:hypothetical protein GQ44DRAFT_779141 [Phaeosphaeriaceae sp. PMI808]|nr:hypothetical protein GQ44DRAFT_779141 [Phaeosphaeriaceae sp. PMI808]
MPTNFFSLPSELRNTVYEFLLLQKEPIDPWGNHNRPQELTLGLFRASKTVYRESSSLFYAQNRFDFTRCFFENIASFLEQIGHENAQHIRHIYLDFPNFLCLDPDEVTLEGNDVRILAKIQNDCTNLSTLTTSLYSTNAMELRLNALDNFKVADQALKLVNDRFKAISSLREIIVEVYEDGPSDHIRSEMKDHGWTIIATEDIEQPNSGRSFDDSEVYGYSYDENDSDGDNEYDIDNDSDFWRRAGD